MTKCILHVEISGVCLHVRRKNNQGITVLMPDARFAHKNHVKHGDGTDAVAHVPYLRINMANLATDGAFLGDGDANMSNGSPMYEIIHRIDREAIDFGAATPEGVKENVFLIPEASEFAPVLELSPNLLSVSKPPKSVVGRIQLNGGVIQSTGVATQNWKFTGELREDGKDVEPKQYGGVIDWSREFDGPNFTLTLKSLDDATTRQIPLVARKDNGQLRIKLKIANLCALNPLEWDELPENTVLRDDNDFKWVYQFLQLKPGKDPKKFPRSAVPCPSPVKSANEGELQDCFGGAIAEE